MFKAPAKDTQVSRVARDIASKIAALQEPVSDEDVLAVMERQSCPPAVLGDAFWLLDNQPSRFANHQQWHPRLRSLRNHPSVGERMFALF